MRTIKFRGQRVDNKEWVYGYYVESTARFEGWDETGVWFLIYVLVNDFEEPYHYKVIPETVGQFTGLTDKNGVEIYEGDVLRTWYSRDMSGMDVVVMENPVEFEIQSERSGFDIPFLHTAEIIGNIHNK